MQWNDPDAALWILMYVVVSAISFFAFRGKHNLWLNAGLVAILTVALISYVPELLEWMDDDMPSITDSMQASSPYIELVRESLGLAISLVAMIFYLLIAKRNK